MNWGQGEIEQVCIISCAWHLRCSITYFLFPFHLADANVLIFRLWLVHGGGNSSSVNLTLCLGQQFSGLVLKQD